MVDDPYLFGRIAANHALGDIYAMGGLPDTALAIATLPPARPPIVEHDLYHMLRGALDVLEPAGAVLDRRPQRRGRGAGARLCGDRTRRLGREIAAQMRGCTPATG